MYCVAGADLPADDRRIARWFQRRGLTESDVVRNDTFAVLRAGTERTWGVAVVCGYGTNCSAVAPNGRTFRFPAFGDLSGDWGGVTTSGTPPFGTPLGPRTGEARRRSFARSCPALRVHARRQLTEAMYFVGSPNAV